jgi:hypothetical protein
MRTSRSGQAALSIAVLLVSTAVFSCPAGTVYQVLNLVEATVLIGVMLGILHLRARRARQTETPIRQAEPANVITPGTCTQPTCSRFGGVTADARHLRRRDTSVS